MFMAGPVVLYRQVLRAAFESKAKYQSFPGGCGVQSRPRLYAGHETGILEENKDMGLGQVSS